MTELEKAQADAQRYRDALVHVQSQLFFCANYPGRLYVSNLIDEALEDDHAAAE